MVQKQVLSGGTMTSVRRIQGLGFPGGRDWSFVHFVLQVGIVGLKNSIPRWIARHWPHQRPSGLYQGPWWLQEGKRWVMGGCRNCSNWFSARPWYGSPQIWLAFGMKWQPSTTRTQWPSGPVVWCQWCDRGYWKEDDFSWLNLCKKSIEKR